MTKTQAAPYQILDGEGNVRDLEMLTLLARILTAEDLQEIYWRMILARAIHMEGTRRGHSDDMTLWIGPMGQEAAEIASAYCLPGEVRSFEYGRSWGVHIGRGASTKSVFDPPFCNLNTGTLQDLSRHGADITYVTVAIHLPQAVGWSMKAKIIDKKILPAIAYFGDGATAEGFFHEALNWASVFEVPVIFFCENNQYAISTPVRFQSAVNLVDRALGYGMAAEWVDGNDIFAVCFATLRALKRAYYESKPTFIVAETYRLGEHTTAAGEIIKIPEKEKQEARKSDPLKRMQKFLFSAVARELFGVDVAKEDNPRLYGETIAEFGVGEDENGIYKDTNVEMGRPDRTLYALAYAEAKRTSEAALQEFKAKEAKGEELIQEAEAVQSQVRVGKRYQGARRGFSLPKAHDVGAVDALGLAIYDALRFDSEIIYLGEDAGEAGGVMRITALREDLAEKERFIREKFPNWRGRILRKYLPLKHLFPANILGSSRIMDTPLDESGTVGVGVGISLAGARPVMEMQFGGFWWMAAAQIKELSRGIHRHLGLISQPGVVVMPFGGGERIEDHNECELPFLVNNPGLIVVCPSTPQDFYDMFWASVASDNPVIFFANINLFRVPRTGELLRRPPQKALEEFGLRVVQEAGGDGVTVLSYGNLVHECLEAAKLAVKEEPRISVEVLDLRVLSPLDTAKIIESVGKTGRLVIVEESPVRFGIGAEVAALASEEIAILEALRAPVCRMGRRKMWMPAPKLCRFAMPRRTEIAQKIIETYRSEI